jgi:hypothetical protein
VIVVTVVAERGAMTGFNIQDVLVKPVHSAQLLTSLRRAHLAPDARRPILVVDDHRPTLKLAERTLHQLGYRAMCCTGAEEALRVARREPPAAVVLDLLMPGLDGFEFLKRFRRSPGCRRTPVIVWTVKDLTRKEREQLEQLAQAIVSKSKGTAALVEELGAYAPLASAAVPEEA